MIDDSALIHGRAYDPVKAREYYLRTRKLKGRQRSVTPEKINPDAPAAFKKAASGNEGKYAASQRRHGVNREQRLKDLKARLDRLRDELAKRVKEAQELQKKNAPKRHAADKKDTSNTRDKSSPSDKQKAAKGSSPRSAKEKRDDAKRSEEYRKKHPQKTEDKPDPSIQQQIERTEREIREIRQQLKDIVARARKNSSDKTTSPTARKGR